MASIFFGKEYSVFTPQHLHGIHAMNSFVMQCSRGNIAQAVEAQNYDRHSQYENGSPDQLCQAY